MINNLRIPSQEVMPLWCKKSVKKTYTGSSERIETFQLALVAATCPCKIIPCVL
jgi:hypothetical protein